MKKLLILALLATTGCTTMARIGFICMGVIGTPYDSSRHNIVEYVLNHSPAEKLGIVKGDFLIDPSDLHGRPGDEVEVWWIHENTLHVAKTHLVCLDDLQEPRQAWPTDVGAKK